jgi:transmembrane sensor
MQKNYESYNSEQFLNDSFFIQWIKDESPEVNSFWKEWIAGKPANILEMRSAEQQLRAILSAKRIKSEAADAEEVWARIENSLQEENLPSAKIRKMSQRWWAAAAVLLLLGSGSYFLLNREHSKREVAVVKKNAQVNDVAPGGNKAILTLANGSTIILNNAKNGALTQQGNTKVVKLDDGQLAYQSEETNRPIAVQYNTVSTPRGGQYQLTLADGSKVWLNAESTITFPTAFTGKERRVEIKGEAYFEVAHDASRPFKVTVNAMEVQVIGTHFNINAYDDEGEIKTTLLEGSVKVLKGTASRLIKPGEQAIVSTGNDLNIQVQPADVDEAVAWKNGLFHFDNADLQEVMRQLSRWYDVDVVYDGTIPERQFAGEMQRDLRLSQVLELLEKNQVNFKIEGKKIMVMAN